MKNKLKICMSFDDGRKDFYEYAFPILKKYNLTASFNVTTGYVDGSFKPNWKTSEGAVTEKELSEMKDYGIEIAFHGDQHITDIEDFKTSINKMKKWNLLSKYMGFAVPGSYLKNVDIEKLKTFLKDNNIIYMRVDNDKKCEKFFNKVYRKLYRITNISLFYSLYNKNNLFKKSDNYNVPSVIVFEKDSDKTLINFVKNNLSRNKNLVFMFHGILPKEHTNYGKDEYAWDLEKFDNFCKFLNQLKEKNKLDVVNLIDIIKEK